MQLLLVYAGFVVVGEVMAAGLGLYLDHVAPTLALPIALSLIFCVLYLAFPVAVIATRSRARRAEQAV
jgi:hypothetical protein